MTIIKNFHEIDPFNPENTVTGWLNRHAYGTLYITHVNNMYCPQEIICTPKISYPFIKDGETFKWHLPQCYGIESYEKYDGTNILQFTYNNIDNKTFVSYKTRRMMFVREDSEFYPLLNGILQKNEDIKFLPFANHCNISYELVGYLNPHLIIYDYPIVLKLLFGIKRNRTIIPPGNLLISNGSEKLRAKLLFSVKDNGELEALYNQERHMFEKELVKKGSELSGREGAVWYAMYESYCKMLKVKPPTIEEIHWTRIKKQGMTKYEIMATIRNAMEDVYPVTREVVEDLLLLEYTKEEIRRQTKFIRLYISSVNTEKKYERQIISVFKENNLSGSKADILRWFAKEFGNINTTKIYHILLKYGLL